jgi:hypothetical protein
MYLIYNPVYIWLIYIPRTKYEVIYLKQLPQNYSPSLHYFNPMFLSVVALITIIPRHDV